MFHRSCQHRGQVSRRRVQWRSSFSLHLVNTKIEYLSHLVNSPHRRLKKRAMTSSSANRIPRSFSWLIWNELKMSLTNGRTSRDFSEPCVKSVQILIILPCRNSLPIVWKTSSVKTRNSACRFHDTLKILSAMNWICCVLRFSSVRPRFKCTNSPALADFPRIPKPLGNRWELGNRLLFKTITDYR